MTHVALRDSTLIKFQNSTDSTRAIVWCFRFYTGCSSFLARLSCLLASALWEWGRNRNPNVKTNEACTEYTHLPNVFCWKPPLLNAQFNRLENTARETRPFPYRRIRVFHYTALHNINFRYLWAVHVLYVYSNSRGLPADSEVSGTVGSTAGWERQIYIPGAVGAALFQRLLGRGVQGVCVLCRTPPREALEVSW